MGGSTKFAGRGRPWWMVLGLAVGLVGTLSGSAPRAAGVPSFFGVAGNADEDEALEQQMHRIEDQLKSLRRGLRKPESNAESLGQIATMQEAMLAAKLLTPRKAASVPEAERAAFVVAYRQEMIAALQKMLELESVVLAGDNDRAQELYRELKLAEDAGHDKFTEREGGGEDR